MEGGFRDTTEFDLHIFFILFLTRLFIAECFGGQFRAVELAGLFSHGGLSVSLRATILRHGKSQLPHIKMAIGS